MEMMLPAFYIDGIIKTALSEDINYIDVATDLLIPADEDGSAYLLAKDSGVLCGIGAAIRAFQLLDESFSAAVYFDDGDRVGKGDIIARLYGKTAFLLKGERTALNILQHMSGIATATAAYVNAAAGTRAVITDTRKTLPGLRAMEKYAVMCGGGRNHRFNLSDGAMLKDNHIDACGGITSAVSTLRGRLGHMVKIEVETRNLGEVSEALAAGADVIMLDNMSTAEMADAVKLVDGRAVLEASGNVTLERIGEIAATGVDIISSGSLTHSVKAFDISLKYGDIK